MANFWRLRRYTAVAAVVGTWFGLSCTHRVPTGNVLVVIDRGSTERKILGPGLHWVTPNHHLSQLSVNFQLAEQVVRSGEFRMTSPLPPPCCDNRDDDESSECLCCHLLSKLNQLLGCCLFQVCLAEQSLWWVSRGRDKPTRI